MTSLDMNLNRTRTGARSRAALGVSASGFALALVFAATPAFAQTGAPAAAVEEIVVTGSRITSAGFTAPTPTTVVGVEAIEKAALPNLFNQITQLPSLAGSTGTTVNNGNTSTGQTGLSSFGLRGLNPIRTLTLLDGQRVVPAFRTGIADASMFPNLLIKQVDVVTGGASSSYGSDAVAGVINFVTDTRFKGYKANIQAGESTYGDSRFANVQLAVGQDFLNDRLHVQASGEYYRNNGVPPGEVGVIQPNGRNWFQGPGTVQTTIANTPAGRPQITFGTQSQQYLYSKYGLITSGPLQGTAFGDNGVPYQFQYGSNGVPVRGAGNNASNAVIGCVAPLCFGGDRTGEVSVGTQVDSPLRRAVFYGRTGFELNDNVEIYASVNLAQVKTSNQPNAGAVRAGNIVVQCDNAFLPTSVTAGCAANNIRQFNFGTANANYPENLRVNNDRQQKRYVIGAMGNFDLLGTNWAYDGYYQHGEQISYIDVTNITIPARFLAAMDAVRDASGAIVCRSAAARAGGCIPWNAFGNNAPNLAAFRYFTPVRGPYNKSYGSQKVAAFSVNGEPFQGWAGPIAVAAGAEWREEYYKQRGDVYGNGLAPESPYTIDYPQDPLITPTNVIQGNNWYAGNFHNGQGKYTVKEAFLELNVPLFDNDVVGKANFNTAARLTDYSTSGSVTTWKVGGTWDTPLEGLRLRAVRSRDIRAPNLDELYSAPQILNSTVTNRLANNAQVQLVQQTIGNVNLKPEESDNTQVGVVYRPTWLPGFSTSLDYYNIEINGAVGALGAQQIVDLCQVSGNAAYCSLFKLDGAQTTDNFLITQPFNLASIKTSGYDFEASYRFNLERWSVPGNFTVRGLITHIKNFTNDPGVVGQPISQSAGSGGLPDWKGYFTQSWDNGPFSLNLTERWVDDSVFNANQIMCQTNCPVSTIANPTINYNILPGQTLIDIGGSWAFREGMQVYFKIDNVANKEPEPNGGNLYDNVGRMYRVGFRITG